MTKQKHSLFQHGGNKLHTKEKKSKVSSGNFLLNNLIDKTTYHCHSDTGYVNFLCIQHQWWPKPSQTTDQTVWKHTQSFSPLRAC